MYPILEKFRIVTAASRDEKTALLSSVIDEFAMDPENPHAAVYLFQADSVKLIASLEYSIVSVGFGECPAALGDWGKFFQLSDGVDTTEEVPITRGPLRNLAWIGGHWWASGGAMQVFQRQGRDKWIDMSPVEEMRAEFGNHNFEGIDGYTHDEVYVTGDAGVVWYWDGSVWTPIQCATNASFYAVHCAVDGWVYAVGQFGSVARGRHGAFELLHLDADIVNLWDVTYYNGDIYAAGFTALFVLDQASEFSLLARPLELASNYYDLSSTDGVLWSFGMKDVLRFDGENWTRIDEVAVE